MLAMACGTRSTLGLYSAGDRHLLTHQLFVRPIRRASRGFVADPRAACQEAAAAATPLRSARIARASQRQPIPASSWIIGLAVAEALSGLPQLARARVMSQPKDRDKARYRQGLTELLSLRRHRWARPPPRIAEP